jgi:hypothetical protein
MSHLEAMLDAHPRPLGIDRALLTNCITACVECADTCTSCVDACLAEQDLQSLVRCIRLNLDCADSCATTSRMLLRQTEPDWTLLRAQLQACATACRSCGTECERHAPHMKHCRVCADACARCADACDRLLAALPVA